MKGELVHLTLSCANYHLLPGFVRKESSNIYRFPLIKTEEEKEYEQNLIASQQVISAKQQSRVKQVTRDLVQWGEQLVNQWTVLEAAVPF